MSSVLSAVGTPLPPLAIDNSSNNSTKTYDYRLVFSGSTQTQPASYPQTVCATCATCAGVTYIGLCTYTNTGDPKEKKKTIRSQRITRHTTAVDTNLGSEISLSRLCLQEDFLGLGGGGGGDTCGGRLDLAVCWLVGLGDRME